MSQATTVALLQQNLFKHSRLALNYSKHSWPQSKIDRNTGSTHLEVTDSETPVAGSQYICLSMEGKSEGGCCSNQWIEWACGCTRHGSLCRCYSNCAQLSLAMLPHLVAHSLCRLLGAWPDASSMHRYCGSRRDVSRRNMSSFYFNSFTRIIPYRLHAGPVLREVTWNCARLRNKKDRKKKKRYTKTIQEKSARKWGRGYTTAVCAVLSYVGRQWEQAFRTRVSFNNCFYLPFLATLFGLLGSLCTLWWAHEGRSLTFSGCRNRSGKSEFWIALKEFVILSFLAVELLVPLSSAKYSLKGIFKPFFSLNKSL